jgi:hypothetical protein
MKPRDSAFRFICSGRVSNFKSKRVLGKEVQIKPEEISRGWLMGFIRYVSFKS